MNEIKLKPTEIFEEYRTGKAFKTQINLYENVKRNENFYIGKQWDGVNAPNLPKPTLNILKRVVSYFISMIVSDDVCARVNLATGHPNREQQQLFAAVTEEIDGIIEQNKVKSQNRQMLRDGAVDGDACLYAWFDPNIKTDNLTQGAVKTEILSNTEVYFGNPNISDVQKQPYILLAFKKFVGNVTTANGKEILPNMTDTYGDKGAQTVTVIRKLFKEKGVVWATEVTDSEVIKKPIKLGYSLYPLVWFSWEKVKNCYHGQSCMTPVIQNQIDINRLFAMCIKQVKDGAFPKILYNKSMLPDGWDNKVGSAIGVIGDVNQAVVRSTGVSEMSRQVLDMISLLIEYTKETMGASDTALGNVDPKNTSAIIALQKSSAMPLELQKLDFYAAVEDYARVFLDIISVNYGKRFTEIKGDDGEIKPVIIDFDLLRKMQLRVNVDVGQTSYFSDIASIATLDNLFEKGILTDVEAYIECLPNGTVQNKEKILKMVRENKKGKEILPENKEGIV